MLRAYINSGEVVYKYFPGSAQQLVAYQEAVNDYKNKTKYMGFIDLDEFVMPVEQNSLVYAIDDIMKKDNKIAGVGVNWLVYGSSGLINKPEGLVEYIKKKDRGLADHAENLKRTMADFYAHDKNDVYDYIMELYVAKLKTKPAFDYQRSFNFNNDKNYELAS